MKRTLYLPLLLSLLTLWLPQPAQSQVEGAPAKIDYQGHVLDSAGNPLSTGTATNYTMEFRLYAAQTGGTPLWTETQTVTVSDGDFSVRLGEGVPIGNQDRPDLSTVFNQRERFLGITVVIPGQTPGEIAPRLAFLTAPYSFTAERAKTADSVTQGAGNSTLGTTSIVNLTVTGPTNVNGNNYVQFGNNVAGRQVDAGKVGYQLFSNNALDIVGAGTTGTNRRVKVFAEGGAEFTGPISSSSVSATTFNGGTFNGTFAGNGANVTSLSGGNLTANSVDKDRLAAIVREALCPVGTIVAFAGDNPPQGWLMCDGSPQSRATFQNLFGVIGVRFGTDTTADFRVPDFRGRFLRGRDVNTNPARDPDRALRGPSGPGGATGVSVGSLQSDDFRSHAHGYGDIYWSEFDGSISVPQKRGHSGAPDFDNFGHQVLRTSDSSHAGALPGDPRPGNETRPTNVNVNYIIKF